MTRERYADEHGGDELREAQAEAQEQEHKGVEDDANTRTVDSDDSVRAPGSGYASAGLPRLGAVAAYAARDGG